MLPGYAARCLLPPGCGLASGCPDAHQTRAAGPGTGPDATPTRTGLNYPRRPRSQYTSAACRARVAQAGALASFSRHGNPYDNAQAEAGWNTLKTELLPGGSPFASLEEARLEVAYYLDTYFNLDRRHSALGYRSPHQFEHDLKTNPP